MFVETIMDETCASLAQAHPDPDAFNVLLIKVNRAYASNPNTDILNRIQSFEVAYGTAYSEYLPAYRSYVTDLTMGCPTYPSLVGADIAAVRDNLYR